MQIFSNYIKLHYLFRNLLPPIIGKRKIGSGISQLPIVKQFLKVVATDNKLLEKSTTVQNLINQKNSYEHEYLSLQSLKENDKDMLALIDEEKTDLVEAIDEINQNILSEFVPLKENRDIVLEVTAGVGGKEAMHFAAELFEMYGKYCSYKRWQWEVQEMDVPELGGMRHGSAFISGRNAYSILMQESGVHRVQRVPATEKSGRIHTSTVTVAILPQPTDVEVVIKDKDIKIETKTSSGAGGQHVNKTESCVRITHLPTGIIIENQTDRSQLNNKKIAMQRLRSKLYQIEQEDFRSKTQSSRKEQVGTSMRSEKIRTYNFPQDRVTDHRVGTSLHNLPQFINGGAELDQLISKLEEFHQDQQLLNVIEEYLKRIRTNA